MDVACPKDPVYAPTDAVLEEINKIAVNTGSVIRVVDDVLEAARNSDIVSLCY